MLSFSKVATPKPETLNPKRYDVNSMLSLLAMVNRIKLLRVAAWDPGCVERSQSFDSLVERQ